MNTHETYVSLEVAKLLKEAGFDWECKEFWMRYIDDDDELCYTDEFYLRSGNDLNWNDNVHSMSYDRPGVVIRFSAPTLAIADKWLREKLNTHIEVMFSNTGHNYFLRYCDVTVHGIGDGHWHRIGSNDGYKTYEEALEVGIKKTLEIILEKGE